MVKLVLGGISIKKPLAFKAEYFGIPDVHLFVNWPVQSGYLSSDGHFLFLWLAA